MNSINLRVNDELKGAIDKAAESEGLPVASYVKSLLTKELRARGFLPVVSKTEKKR